MNLFEMMDDRLMNTKRFESAIRYYGADKISSYATSIAAFGVAVSGGASLAVMAAVPVIAVAVSFINKLEHDYKERDLLEVYREQIAAAKGSDDPTKIRVQDLQDFAGGKGAFKRFGPNPLLKQELANYNRQLNTALVTHALSAAVFATMAVGAAALAPLYSQLEASISPFISSLGLGAAAVLAYEQIDSGLSSVGTLLAPIKKTAHEDIKNLEESLHKGETVRPLKVYGIMVKSSPVAQKRVRDKFSTNFDDLYLSQKKEMMLSDAKRMDFGRVTNDLNQGRLEAEDVILLLGNKPAMSDPAVAAQLRKFHHYKAQVEASIMPSSQKDAAFGKMYHANHTANLEAERAKPAQPELSAPTVH